MGNTIRTFQIDKQLKGNINQGNINQVIDKMTLPSLSMYHPLIVSIDLIDNETFKITDMVPFNLLCWTFSFKISYTVRQRMHQTDDGNIHIESIASAPGGLKIHNITTVTNDDKSIWIREITQLYGNVMVVWFAFKNAYNSHVKLYDEIEKSLI